MVLFCDIKNFVKNIQLIWRKNKMKNATVKVNIDGKSYLGIRNAADSVGLTYNQIVNCYKKNDGGTFVIDGKTISFGTRRKHLHTSRCCGVKCITTGKIYDSITEASKDAHAKLWTMSVKMQETGKFIDKKGHEYIRLQEMKKRTNNSYCVKTSTVRPVKSYTHKTAKVTPSAKTEIMSSNNLLLDTAIGSIKTGAVNLMKLKKYNEASSLLNILANLDK
jgi:hypothetical protein